MPKLIDCFDLKASRKYIQSNDFKSDEYKELWHTSKAQKFGNLKKYDLEKAESNFQIVKEIINAHIEIIDKDLLNRKKDTKYSELINAREWLKLLLKKESDLLYSKKNEYGRFIDELSRLIETRIKTSGPWGYKIKSITDVYKNLSFVVPAINEKDLRLALEKVNVPAYIHRDYLISDRLPPIKHSIEDGKILYNSNSLRFWVEKRNQTLLMFNPPDLKVSSWKMYFDNLRDYLNLENRYSVQNVYANVVTESHSIHLGIDFVALEKSEFGLEGRWIIYMTGIPEFAKNIMKDFGWISGSDFLLKYRDLLAPHLFESLQNYQFHISKSSDSAKVALGLFLEEFLIYALKQKVKSREIFIVRYPENQRVERARNIKSLQVREQWIRNYDRNDPIDYCIVCGHGLSRADSLLRQIGPHCWEKLTHEKRINASDLRIGYSPYLHEAATPLNTWKVDLMNFTHNLQVFSAGSTSLPEFTYRLAE